MAYNNYSYGGYGYPQYNTGVGYQQFQQPLMQQQMINPQQQNNEIPFSEMHFGTMKEAEAHIVAPMKSAVFVNKALGEIYVKSADSMGNPLLETFKKVGIENEPTKLVSAEIDTKEFVKSGELANFIQRDEIKDFIRRDELANFITKDDIKSLNLKLDNIQKQIKINDISKGEQPNGN